MAPKKAPKNGAQKGAEKWRPGKKRGAEKRRPKKGAPGKKEASIMTPLPDVFFTLRFQLPTFQKAERKSFFLCAL